MSAVLAACRKHPIGQLQRPYRHVTPCPRFCGFTCAPTWTCRRKPARDRWLAQEKPVHDSGSYLQAMQSVGESRQRVTFPEPCPHFPAQVHADPQVASASRRVTPCRNRRLPCLPKPSFSSYGADRRADAPVRQRDSLAGHVPAERGTGGAAAVIGISRSRFSGRKWLY